MATRKLMSYIFITAAALLLVGGEARKFAGVNPFCRTASHRLSCTEMVNGAKTQKEASVNAIKDTIVLGERLKGLVSTIEPAIAHLSENAKWSIRESCTKRFDDAIDNLKTSMEAMDSGDVDTAKTYLSGAAADYCKDAFEEFNVGQDLPLNKYSSQMNQKIDNCLAVVLQI